MTNDVMGAEGYSVRRGGGGEIAGDDDVEGHGGRHQSKSGDDDVEGHGSRHQSLRRRRCRGPRQPSPVAPTTTMSRATARRHQAHSDDDDVEGHGGRHQAASDDDDVEGHRQNVR